MSRKSEYLYHPAKSKPEDKHESSGCCQVSQLKFSLYLFNILFCACGAILVAVGVWTLLEKHPSLLLLTAGLYDLTASVLIFIGIVILIVAIAGFCGASRNNNCLISTYAILLCLIFMIEIGAGLLAYFYKDQLANHLGRNLQIRLRDEYGINNDTTIAVDHLQSRFQCCGVVSSQSNEPWKYWQQCNWWTNQELRKENKVPDSCCRTQTPNCGKRDHPSNIYRSGCISRITQIAKDHLIIIGALAIGICLVQLIGIILACALQCRLRRIYHYG